MRRSDDTNHKTRLKIAFLRSQPDLLATNELMPSHITVYKNSQVVLQVFIMRTVNDDIMLM